MSLLLLFTGGVVDPKPLDLFDAQLEVTQPNRQLKVTQSSRQIKTTQPDQQIKVIA